MKKCIKCESVKELIEFTINKKMKDGHSKICKDCHNLSIRNKTLKLRESKVLNGYIKLKICNICNIEKRLSKFNKSKKTLDGYLDGCIECKRNLKKENEINIGILKKCKDCHITKSVNNFYKCAKIKDGYFNICIDCEKKRSLEYYTLYTMNGIKKSREHSTIDNKIKSNLKKRIRSAIANILKERGFRKKSKTLDILGCSFEEFKLYLESKFEDWMTWENRGMYNGEFNYGWDIDHIIPVSSAKTEEEILLLNHYTNLQPLCSKVNRDIKKNNI